MKIFTRRISRSTLTFLLAVSLLGFSCSGGDSGAPAGLDGGDQPVVYIADADMAGQSDLYASFDNGSEIVKLSEQPFGVVGDVKDFKISPDGEYVAFRADHETAGEIELYTVPITGGIPVNVSRGFFGLLEVEDDYEWAPDGTRIAFLAFNANSGTTTGNIELFTNRPDANGLAKISKAAIQDREVREFTWAPDSQQVAYTANISTGPASRFDLYTTSPVSQDNINTTAFFNDFTDAVEISWSPNSVAIAFLADIRFSGVDELIIADPSSVLPSAVPISGTINSDDAVFSFAWAPDSSRIAFLADKKTPDQVELFSVRPDGSDSQTVSDLAASENVTEYAWAPDASLLAYIADEDTAALELFTARPDGIFSSIRVSGAPTSGNVAAFAWAPNADFIAYRADEIVAGRPELFVALPGVSNSGMQVSGPMLPALPNGFVREFAWAPDSSRVAYLADQATANQVELFSSTPDGSINDVVSGPIVPAAGDVQAPDPPFTGAAFLWSPDAARLAYRADQEIDDVFELYSSRADGSENTKISQDLTFGKTVQGFAWGSEAF